MLLCAPTVIGIEITRTNISAALLLKQRGLPALVSSASCIFAPDTLKVNQREPNVCKIELFNEQLRRLMDRLQTREKRVALSLPDASGRVLLVNLENRWSSREEALEMINWKLRKMISWEAIELQIDFQPLSSTGELNNQLLVAAIARPIIEQYEELLLQAGLQPDWISFFGLNLARAFEEYLCSASDVCLVYWQDHTLGTLFFQQGVPVFYRTKQLPPEQSDQDRIAMECTCSLLAYRQQFPGTTLQKVLLYAAHDSHDSALRELLAGCFEQPLQPIEPSALCVFRNASLPEGVPLHTLTGAITAAVGGLACA